MSMCMVCRVDVGVAGEVGWGLHLAMVVQPLHGMMIVNGAGHRSHMVLVCYVEQRPRLVQPAAGSFQRDCGLFSAQWGQRSQLHRFSTAPPAAPAQTSLFRVSKSERKKMWKGTVKRAPTKGPTCGRGKVGQDRGGVRARWPGWPPVGPGDVG